jgi:hypothetical protein
MRTNSMTRLSGRALAVFATVVILSDWAMAQQTGLFPLAPIRRQRPPCDQQDPVYRLYKDQYFGYHPTLWRRFPSGWGAPSPEAPDAAKSFKEIPLETLDGVGIDQGDEQPEQGPDMQGQPGQGQPADDRPRLPKPPAEDNRSPFEIDAPAAAPNEAQPPARGEPSPFDLPGPRAGAPRSPQPAAPELAPPSTPTTRVSRRRRPAEIDPADAGSPLLSAAEDLDREAVADSALLNVGGPIDAGPAVAAPAEAGDRTHQHQPAARRSRLGTMLGSLGWNVRR